MPVQLQSFLLRRTGSVFQGGAVSLAYSVSCTRQTRENSHTTIVLLEWPMFLEQSARVTLSGPFLLSVPALKGTTRDPASELAFSDRFGFA